MSMKSKFILVILFSIFITIVSFPITAGEVKKTPSIDFSKDIKRLSILQNKFTKSKDPVERYKYASIITDYLKRMSSRIEKVKTIYYKPAMFIMAEELPDTIKLKNWDVEVDGTID